MTIRPPPLIFALLLYKSQKLLLEIVLIILLAKNRNGKTIGHIMLKLKRDDVKIRLATEVKDFIGGDVRLIGVRPFFKYTDGKRTDTQLGFAYEVVLMERAFEKIVVKVEEAAPSIEPERITGNGIPVTIDGLEAKVYATVNNGFVNFNASFSAKEVKRKGGQANA
jgi:hypothetical protein